MNKLMSVVAVVTMFCCMNAFAAMIPLQNSGFELPVLSEGGLDTTTMTGWKLDTAGRAFRTWNVDSSYALQPTEGSNFMWIAPAGSSTQISQITNYQIESGMQYSLRFDVAMVSSFAGTPSYTALIYATNGGVSSRTTSRQLVTTGSVTISKDNTWRTVTLNWDSTGTSFVGEKFDIVIGGKAMIDNFRMTVPEPATILMLGCGLFLRKFSKKQ